MTVPRNCLSPPHWGKALAPLQTVGSTYVDCIPHPYPPVHGRRSNDVSRLALRGLSDRHVLSHVPHSSPSQPSRSICAYGTVTEWAPPRLGWLPTGLHVCALRVRQVGAMRSCALQGCILRPARLPDTIISTNEPSSTPSNAAGGTAPTLKHSPGPPFRVVAGWMPQAGSVDLHRSGQSQGQPWPSPGPKEIDYCAANQPGGRVAAISGRAFAALQPRSPWPIGLG